MRKVLHRSDGHADQDVKKSSFVIVAAFWFIRMEEHIGRGQGTRRGVLHKALKFRCFHFLVLEFLVQLAIVYEGADVDHVVVRFGVIPSSWLEGFVVRDGDVFCHPVPHLLWGLGHVYFESQWWRFGLSH